MSDLQKKIKKTMEEVRQRERVRHHIADLEQRLATVYKEQKRLGKVLEKEYKDLESLEKLSLKSMFHKILGSKEEQLERERQEYLQASLKYDEHKKTIELMEYEQKVLVEKLEGKRNLEGALEKMLQQRERELIRGNKAEGHTLLRIQKDIDEQQMMLSEIKEAIHVGQEALQVLESMLGFLKRASNWGQWSQSSRRRRGMNYQRHTNIDRAREQGIYAQQLLNRFERELRDIYQNVERFQLNWQMNAFGNFIDIFFDNLISDWIIQKKIRNAFHDVQAVRDRLLRMLEGLRNEQLRSKSQIRKLQGQRRKVLSA